MIAILLAFIGTVIPVAGLHKLYLGQFGWGVVYLLLSWTPIPHVASAIEGVWYLTQDPTQFDANFNGGVVPILSQYPAASISPPPTAIAQRVEDVAGAMRQLDQLREDGLISEYEFEQKRRQLLDQIV